jgi:beta-lactamase class A
MRLAAVTLVVLCLAAGGTAAPSPTLAPPLSELVATLDGVTPGAAGGDPELAQARYDAARSLTERILGRLRARGRATCAERAALHYARAGVHAVERFDRLRPTGAAEEAAAAARRALAAGACPAVAPGATPAVVPLPASARIAARPPRPDATLASRLATATGGFPGAASAWIHDLRSGRAAGAGEDVRFPAASTVKLGVLVAALDRFGPRPERSPVAHDLAALAGWSSNVAANRLLRLLGRGDERRGVAVVEDRLHRLGATASTYPGSYRAGTARALLPPATGRVTTARDLGRILATLHAAAAGGRAARGRAGLTAYEARVALGLLLAGERSGDNAGILALPAGLPAAQKHGWTSSTRHSAALLYPPAGPVVVVVLTYRPGLEAVEARMLGRRVARLALG